MGLAVAIAADGEFGMDDCRMGLPVAITAGRNVLMPARVALDARHGPVLGGGGGQKTEGPGVAFPAVLGGRLRAEGDGKRRMRRMAGFADRVALAGGMRLVAPEAFGNLPVPIVAGRAGQFPVKARRGLHLAAGLWMACQTRPGELLAQLQLEGGVRIAMALQAVSCFEMRPSRVALPALGNDVSDRGRMPPVAIEAGDLRAMRLPGRGDPADHRRMALVAVGQGEGRLCFLPPARGQPPRGGKGESQEGGSKKGRRYF